MKMHAGNLMGTQKCPVSPTARVPRAKQEGSVVAASMKLAKT